MAARLTVDNVLEEAELLGAGGKRKQYKYRERD